jgi:hypothetical protein
LGGSSAINLMAFMVWIIHNLSVKNSELLCL